MSDSVETSRARSRTSFALSRWCLSLTQVRSDEVVPLLWCWLYIFSVMSAYYIIRPLRDAMGVAGGIKNLPWLFSATLIGMLLVNLPFAALSRKLARTRFIPISYRFFFANLLIFSVLLHFATPSETVWLGRAFFVWVSVFNLFVVSVFWAFVVDVFNSESSKRLFALIAAAATVGAICGSLLTASIARWVSPSILLVLSGCLLELALLSVRRLSRYVSLPKRTAQDSNVKKQHEIDDDSVPVGEPDKESKRPLGGTIFAGISHTLRSAYLSVICLNMLLFSVTSTILYFQTASLAQHAFSSSASRTAFFATLDLCVNILTLMVQLLITARLIRRFGVAVVLTVIPLLSTIGFGLIALLPSTLVLVGFSALRRAGNFAIARPTREVLFTVISREDKYKAKNFIDTVVYRAGDQIGSWSWSGFSALGMSATTISLSIALPLSLAWVCSSFWLGWHQQVLAARQQENPFATGESVL